MLKTLVKIKPLSFTNYGCFKIKRVYDESSKTDGKRILIDRLWPRGLKKENAAIDSWEKDLAPSNELRKWFNHDEKKWKEF